MIKLESYLEKPYIKFILWFLTGLSVILFGVLNVKADTYNATQFTAQLYDNYGPNLSAVTTDFTNNRYQGIISTMVANSSGAAWGISSPIGLLANHTYTMTVEITGTYGGRLVLSTFNRIGVGTTLQNAIYSYQNNSYVNEVYSKVLDSGITLQFAFTPAINSSYIVFPFSTSYSGDNQYFYLSNIIIDDLGSESITQDDINNSLNNQTNVIQNSINNIENNINNTINDNFNTCRESYNLLNPKYNRGFAWSSGQETSSNLSTISSDYISTSSRKTYSSNYSFYVFYYDANYNYLGNSEDLRTTGGVVYTSTTVPNNSSIKYLRLWFRPSAGINPDDMTILDIMFNEGSTVKKYEPYGEEICQNKIDETNDKLDQTNDKLDNIDDTLTDSNIDDENVSSSFENFESFLDDNSTITQLVTLPITLYTAILNNVNGTCIPFNLGNLYGVNLSLPCVNIGNYLGPALWGMIDIIISGFAVYFIAKKLVKIFNNVSSMKEGDVIDD